ncbi:hypothetical protein JAF95_000007 [Citrobacter braakii]|uniref:hypothetical protein n=1 Tax=Citrobacter sp. S46_ASV_140 TaxID=2846983 RepID=UPI001C0ED63B|nr:hypothetical protein [Citrobacter sp. S46_ASV_140]EGT0646965.1 hypothetical protein [Citrobacter braakii]MBU5643379.1 hypothetical protein [Citrobacter sp. S46_ASV_140]
MRKILVLLISLAPLTSFATLHFKCTTWGGGKIGVEDAVSLSLFTDANNVFQGISVNGVEFRANVEVEDMVDSEMNKIRTYSADTKNENNARIQSAFINVYNDESGNRKTSLTIMNVETGGNYSFNKTDSAVIGDIQDASCH